MKGTICMNLTSLSRQRINFAPMPAEIGSLTYAVQSAKSADVLAARDVVHLIELAWQHGYAGWHASKSTENFWPHVRTTTRKRIEVCAALLLCVECVYICCYKVWQHGYAGQHASKSTKNLWPHARARTRKRIEVCA